jgi:hypothetical protein
MTKHVRGQAEQFVKLGLNQTQAAVPLEADKTSYSRRIGGDFVACAQ